MPHVLRCLPRRLAATTRLLLVAAAVGPSAAAADLLWNNQHGDTNFGSTESFVSSGSGQSWEVADDFDVHGLIDRLYVLGHDCFSCDPPNLVGAWVRFYQSTPGGPGALLSQELLPPTGDGFGMGSQGTLDLMLAKPFFASGLTFVSVQLEFGGAGSFYWEYDYKNGSIPPESTTVFGSPAVVKSHANGFQWSPPTWVGMPMNVDMRFQLYGSDGSPPDLGSDPCGYWLPTDVNAPANTSHGVMRDVDVVSATDAWAVGEARITASSGWNTIPVVRRFDGTTWNSVAVPIPETYPGTSNAGLLAVAAVSPTDVWAAGFQVIQAPSGFVGTHMLVMHFDGSSWSIVPTPIPDGSSGDYVEGIEVVSKDDIWFVGDWMEPIKRPALAMRWTGSGFTIYDTPYFLTGGHGLKRASAVSKNDVWAVGGGHDNDWLLATYILHFDGSSWSRFDVPAPGPNILHDVFALASNDVWACGEVQVGANIQPFFLHYDGTSWSQFASPGGGGGIFGLSSTVVYSTGANVVLWDGTAWTEVTGDFGHHLGISMIAVDGAAGCDMIAVGREVVAGDVLPTAVHMNPSTWLTVGGAVGGPAGPPALLGEGLPLPGATLKLSLTNAPPSSAAMLVVSTQLLGQPFYGGFLVPAPTILLPNLPVDALGELDLWAAWPNAATPSGTTFAFQYWMLDPTAPFGVAGSNATLVTTP